MAADREVRMADRELAGVVVAAGPDGRRSTTALGQAVLAAALRPVDEPGAAAVERSTSWRSDYPAHFRRLVEAGLPDPKSWLTVAESGLAELDRQLRLARADGTEDALPAALTEPAGRELGTAEVAGTGEPERELVLPYRGRRLRGDEIRRQVEAWIAAGVAEPSLAEPVEDVLAHPEWLRLGGITVAALGAGAEMAPVPSLLRWGATVAAVDLPLPALWQRLRRTARAGAGRLLVPVDPRTGADGADLLTEVPAVADWLAGQPGRLVLGTYAYADGGLHLRLSGAADVLGRRLRQRRDDLALAFLATPTDTFAVPGDAVAHATRRYDRRSAGAALLRPPLRAVSRGRLLQPPYQPGARPRGQRQPDPAAGAELRAGQAGAAVAGRGRPGRRDAGVLPRRPVRADPLGGQAPGAGRGLQRRPPLRRRGVRAGHRQHAARRAARPRPQHRAGAAGAPLAGRGVRGRPRWTVAGRVRPAQRARVRPAARRAAPDAPVLASAQRFRGERREDF